MSSTARALPCLFLLLSSCGSDEPSKIPPPSPGEQLCASIVDSISGCAEPSECQEAIVGDCADVVGVMGDPFLNAWRACLDDGGDLGTCAIQAGAAAEITEAKRGFAQSFCDHCALGVPGCVDLLFGGDNPELAPIAQVMAPLSDAVVQEITGECTQGLTCMATFSSCVQGVLAKRALPEKTLLCLFDQLRGADGGACQPGPGAGGAGGEGASGGGGGGEGLGAAGATGGSSGEGGGATGGAGGASPNCPTDAAEPNDSMSQAAPLDAQGDNKLSDCEADQTISGVLGGTADDDWFGYYGMDAPCLADIQPHATVQAAHPVKVCVYLQPLGNSAPPTCLEGTAAETGSYMGCCGNMSARLQFGANLQNDDANVRVVLSSLDDVCIDYTMTYGFGSG